MKIESFFIVCFTVSPTAGSGGRAGDCQLPVGVLRNVGPLQLFGRDREEVVLLEEYAVLLPEAFHAVGFAAYRYLAVGVFHGAHAADAVLRLGVGAVFVEIQLCLLVVRPLDRTPLGILGQFFGAGRFEVEPRREEAALFVVELHAAFAQDVV